MRGVATQLRDIVAGAGVSLREISRRSGVSRNTIDLWLKGETQPTLGTLNEVLATVGMSAEIVLTRSCDPAAAAAVRVRLGDLDEGDIPAGLRSGVEEWAERFTRWGVDGEDLLGLAAQAANPSARPGALFYLPAKVMTFAAAADSLGQRWALSADNLLWCDDPAAVAALLPQRMRQTSRPVEGGVVIAPATGTECIGARRDEAGVWRVTAVQQKLDALSMKAALEGATNDEGN